MKRVLFVTPILEHPPAGGPFLRIENSLKALKELCKLHIISLVPKNMLGGDRGERFYQQISEAFVYAPSLQSTNDGFFIKLKIRLKSWFYFLKNREKNTFFKKLEIDKDAQFINRYVLEHDISIIWFGYGCISGELIYQVRELNPLVKIICDTDSVQSRYFLRELPLVSDLVRKRELLQAAKQRAFDEVTFSCISDVVLAVSEVDARYYKELVDSPEKVIYFPNVIDLSYYEKEVILPSDFYRPVIILSGYFGAGSPMNYAAHWFIKEVFPLILKKQNAWLYCVGRGSKETLGEFADQANIKIIGKVDSVLPYLKYSDVSIVPLFFESGTRFKILEAAATGTPVVSTTLGAEGLEIAHGKNILIADTPSDFAQAVISLLENKSYAQNLAKNCKELVQEKYTLPILVQQGRKILDWVAGK